MPLIAIALAGALQLQPGDLVTFAYAGSVDRVCARVVSIDRGPTDARYAWLVATGPAPQNAAHVQLARLRPGCDERLASD